MQAIIFDFFGVICSEIAPFVLPRYMSAEEAVRYKATVVNDADLGRISQAAMFERLATIAGAPAAQLEREFYELVKIDADVVAIIERLRRDYRVALLTNAIVPFFRDIAAEHGIERLFDTILVSSETGLAKPDPTFYMRLLDIMDVRPRQSLFIDDNPVNLDGAREADMDALLFESAPKLRQDLAARYGISV